MLPGKEQLSNTYSLEKKKKMEGTMFTYSQFLSAIP